MPERLRSLMIVKIKHSAHQVKRASSLIPNEYKAFFFFLILTFGYAEREGEGKGEGEGNRERERERHRERGIGVREKQ